MLSNIVHQFVVKNMSQAIFFIVSSEQNELSTYFLISRSLSWLTGLWVCRVYVPVMSFRANLILIDKKVDVHSPKIKTKPTNPTNMPVVDISSLTQIQSNFSSKLRIFFIQNFFCGLLYVLIITTGGNVWLSFLRDMNS